MAPKERKTSVRDLRFLKLKTDPRFRPLKTKKRRQQPITDSRFASHPTPHFWTQSHPELPPGAADDPAFQDNETHLDKYGRLNLPKPDEEGQSDPHGALQMQRMMGLCPSDSETESSEASLPEQEAVEDWGIGAWAANPDESIPETEATQRIAVVDMDWSKVSATDLLAVFRSFVAETPAAVEKVTIYVSEYGQERLPKEEKQGPSALGLFKSRSGTTDDELVDPEELRLYEKSKLRYYYAVVECSSVSVAQRLVAELDGTEFETSQCTLDLRYIPEDVSFEDAPVKEVAENVPGDFIGPAFECNALQKTNVKLSWDEDDDRRLQVVRRRFTEEELQEQDFQAYLVSESETESDEGDRTQKYASLLADLDTQMNPRQGSKAGATLLTDGDDGESEVDSETGLEAMLKVPEGKAEVEEGKKIWEKYEKRRTQKLKNQRRRGQFRVDSSASESDSGLSSLKDEDPESAFFEEPEQEKEIWVNLPNVEARHPKTETEHQTPGEDDPKAASQLELLMMDDQLLHKARSGAAVSDEVQKGGKREAKRKLSRRQRLQQSITKKKLKSQPQDDLPDFQVNVEDPRFKGLLQSSDFALDPTHPAFKRTPGADTILKRVREKTLSGENS